MKLIKILQKYSWAVGLIKKLLRINRRNKKIMTTTIIENNNPIVSALERVLGLFAISKKEIRVLLPNSSSNDIAQLLDEFKKDNNTNNFVLVYFDYLGNKVQCRLNYDADRFWFEFFQSSGIVYEGNNIISFAKQLKESKKPILWYINLFKLIQKEYGKDNTSEVVEIIDTFNRLNHGHGSENKRDRVKNNEKHETYLTSLKDSILWKFNAKESFRVLIIDDQLYKLKRGPHIIPNEDKKNTIEERTIRDAFELLRICSSLSIECYIVNYTNDDDLCKFKEVVNALIEGKVDVVKHITKIQLIGDDSVKLQNEPIDIKQKEKIFNGFMDFDYLFVDIWFSDQKAKNGLYLIANLHHKTEENVRKKVLTFKRESEKETNNREKNCIIPEILAYTFLEDSETIQMVRRNARS